MPEVSLKLYKKLFVSLENIFGRKFHSRFKRKTPFSQSSAMRWQIETQIKRYYYVIGSMWFVREKNSTNGIVHLLQQSLFKSQCCSRAQVNSSHWNMIRTLRETFSVFHISPKRQRFLERVLGKCGSISRKEKLKDLGKTRWAERHGYYIIGCTLSERSAAAERFFSEC